jgi:hypothetical protein
MRITVNISEEMFRCLEERAKAAGKTSDQAASDAINAGLVTDLPISSQKDGVPLLPARGEVITIAKIRQIMDEEGM